jgi:hypothetical protein
MPRCNYGQVLIFWLNNYFAFGVSFFKIPERVSNLAELIFRLLNNINSGVY